MYFLEIPATIHFLFNSAHRKRETEFKARCCEKENFCRIILQARYNQGERKGWTKKSSEHRWAKKIMNLKGERVKIVKIHRWPKINICTIK